MKKVVFGSAVFIGGILLLCLMVFSNAYFLNDIVNCGAHILIFTLIIAGFIIGLNGLMEDKKRKD
jgi:hypothetical protein